jgi:hypothetical protein
MNMAERGDENDPEKLAVKPVFFSPVLTLAAFIGG